MTSQNISENHQNTYSNLVQRGDKTLLSLSHTRTTATIIDCRVQFSNWWFEADDGSFAPYRCKSWKCIYCREKNKTKLKYMIMELANFFKLKYFWTLTIPHNMSPEESWDYIQYCWKKLQITIKRRYGSTLKYIRVPEAHKSGHAHIHFLTDSFIPVRWLREKWKRIGGGYRMKVELISIQRIAGYLSKYLSKLNCELPKGYRHYSFSKAISTYWQEIRYKTNKTWVLCCRVWVDLPNFGPVEIIREVCKIDFFANYENRRPP